MSASPATLTQVLWPAASIPRRTVRAITLVGGGCLLLAVAAQLRIPFHPVPFTMQTFVVLVVGLTYGPRLAGATVATYLAVGMAGVPVFAGASAGVGVLTGATGGFLLGMLAASIVLGMLGQRGWDRTRTRTLGAMLIGTIIIFTAGVSWLATMVGWHGAITAGVVPFLGSEAAKIALAVATVPSVWNVIRPQLEDQQ